MHSLPRPPARLSNTPLRQFYDVETQTPLSLSMELEFRRRGYKAEEKAYSLARLPAETHPLSAPTPSPLQVELVYNEKDDIFDPLRGSNGHFKDYKDEEINSTVGSSVEVQFQNHSKEWISFKKILMQTFPVAKMIPVSSISRAILKNSKVDEKSSTVAELEELDDTQKFSEGVKVVTQQEYISCLYELRDEISQSWRNDDRVTSLKLSIKVARLLMDTSVVQFYPTLFVLATEVMDLLGDVVWERIKQKAEYAEDGAFISSLPDNFDAANICDDAKETCNNWFCKIGSIRELLPRIYLELAILPCWQFLSSYPAKSLQRLVMMTRGIADPLASAYCHLYMVHRAQKLPGHDVGYMVTGINDLKCLIMRDLSAKQTGQAANGRLLVSLMEPAIEYMMKSIFNDLSQTQVPEILVGLGLGRDQSDLFGDHSCISVVLHHLLKELPIEIICSNAMDILHLIECNTDCSFDQFLNFKLLGLRLCESISQVGEAVSIADKVIQVGSRFDSLDDYLKILDAYVDIILQNQMDTHLNIILDQIFKRVDNEKFSENGLAILQSFFLKLLSHFDNLEDMLSLNHFVEILDVMHGSSRNIINIQILRIATRKPTVQDPITIQFLFEVSQALHDGLDFSNIGNDENRHSVDLISRFINMVDNGPDLERNLSFLVDYRGAFGAMSELKEVLVHRSNLLAIKAMQFGGNSHVSFIKSCLTFSEVTIPSVPQQFRQLNLYLETAEVALLGGLVSHSDGLIDSAICCLLNLDSVDGYQASNYSNACLTSLCKLCSLLVMVPGNLEKVLKDFQRNVFSFLNSQSWVTSKLKIKGLCALISMLAALSQDSLPSHPIHGKVIGNHNLFFGDPTYLQDLPLYCGVIIQKMVSVVLEEPTQATRGNLALEAYNCILSSFNLCRETRMICSKLLEIAELSLSSDNKYLVSSKNLLETGQLG